MSYYNELKRRNVFKVGAAYLALSWIVIQITETLTPVFHLPEAALPLVTWIGVIGFPFVLVFSWIYELTPEGLKRESEVDRPDSITHLTSRRLDYIIIGMLAVAIGLFAYDRLLPVGAGQARENRAQDVTSDHRAQSALLQEEVEPASAVAMDDQSIAVLPFVNMSSDKEQEYFSDGMSEEVLNLLAQVPNLRVIARTSSFAFKGQNIDIAEIAKKLNVAHVLEGSVRKSGNMVRITAQLIRTEDSTHLWSETYDRPLDDIFVVQDEIASAIVQALQIRLLGGELNRRKGGTQNLEAYQLYLRSVSSNYQNTHASLVAAQEYAEQAMKLDPNYGMAWIQLATCIINEADSLWTDAAESYTRARQLAQRALELSPDSADSHALLQYIYLAFDWDWAAAEAEGRLALAIDSTNPFALNVTGKLAATLGRWDEAERNFHLALLRDPLNTYVMWNLANTYYRAGRFAEAEVAHRALLEFQPDFSWTRSDLAKTLLAQGKPDAALAMVQQFEDELDRLWLLPIVQQGAGHQAEADEALQAQIASLANTCAYCVALTYAYRGDNDLALEWLDRAYEQREQIFIEMVGDPMFANLADDPRFKAFLRKMNLPVEWQTTDAGLQQSDQ